MTNISYAREILRKLYEAGVNEIVLCPGARNAPFVELLANWTQGKGRLYTFFEERSASYFALGRIAQSGKPKAVITTSGTAVANLLPAVVEAFYTGAPLVMVTADRPRGYRGTGSPQTIVQPGIFSHYAESFDLETGGSPEFHLNFHGPTHVNVAFDEPLVDEPLTEWSAPLHAAVMDSSLKLETAKLSSFAARVTKPLILVGGLSLRARPMVLEWLRRQEVPILAEAPSGLRGHPAIAPLELRASEKTLKTPIFDSVIRIGHMPTARVWRDLEKSRTPVVSISELPFRGLSRSDADIFALCEESFGETVFRHPELKSILARDAMEWERLQSLLEAYPRSELSLIRRMSEEIREGDSVYLGNSLPIREWDMVARRNLCVERCFANRGVNGIDGQLSTFFGWADPERRNWALLGDLTALYDLTGPWALRDRPLRDFRLAIINNGGGQIFQPMFHQALFENRHAISFGPWAKMWNLEYSSWNGSAAWPAASIVEIIPDQEQTEMVKRKW